MRAAWAVLFVSACSLDLAPRLDGELARVGPLPECVAVGPPQLDFGEVESSMGVTAALTLHNGASTQRVLRVDAVASPFFFSSGFMVVEPHSDLVQSVLFAPTDARLHFETLVFDEGGACPPRHVALRGLGSGRLEFDPVIDFGAVLPGLEKSKPFVIRNSRRVPVTLTMPSTTDGFRVSATGPTVVPPQGEVTLTVTAAPQALGGLMGTLMLQADVGQPVAVALVVRGEGAVSLVSSPVLSAPFAGLWVNATTPGFIERTIEFMSTVDPAQARQVRVLGVSYGADAGSTSELEVTLGPELVAGLAPGQHGTARLRFEPFSLGAHAYHLQFLVEGPGEPPLDVSFTAQVSALPDCELVVSPPDRLELRSSGGLFSGSVFFTNPGPQSCVLDDVALEPGSVAFAPGSFEQAVLLRGEQLEVQVLAFVDDAGVAVDAGALRYHVLAADQPVRRIALVTVP